MATKATKGKRLAKGFNLPKPPKKTEVPEETAEAFVDREEKPSRRSGGLVSLPTRGEDPAPEPEVRPRKTAPKSSKLRRATRGERIAAYIPPELAEALRVRCAKDRRSVSDAVTVAVEEWLGRS